MNAESPQKAADVVSDGLAAEVELVGHLIGGAALLEEAQDLHLTRRQRRMRWALVVFADIRDLAEDADHAVALPQRHRADVDPDPVAVGSHEYHLGVGHSFLADDLAREVLARAKLLLRCDDRRDLSSL